MENLSIIEVNNIIVDIIRKDVKNIHLNVLPPYGDVRVTAPLRNDDESLRLFIISKISWIKKQRKKFENQERELNKEYISGESHYFKGHRYLLNVVYSKDKAKVVIKNKKFIDFYVDKNFSIEKRRKIMEEWYRVEFKKIIPGLIEAWSKKTKTKVADWKVRKMKTKWGSCNKDKRRVWLNLELIKKPVHHIEYVLVHELTHLLVRNHNEDFVRRMNIFMPSWRTIKGELNSFILTHETWER